MNKSQKQDIILAVVLGDAIGLRYEGPNKVNKKIGGIQLDKVEILSDDTFSDDTVLTFAVLKASLEIQQFLPTISKEEIHSLYEKTIKDFFTRYPNRAYGKNFKLWATQNEEGTSFGNGAAMRVSPIAITSTTLDECLYLTEIVTKTSHNHAESIKAAKAVSESIFRAINETKEKDKIFNHLEKYYDLSDSKLNLAYLQQNYTFHATCQQSVPQALSIANQSKDLKECLMNAISIGGDSDTIAGISCSITQSISQNEIDKPLRDSLLNLLPIEFIDLLEKIS